MSDITSQVRRELREFAVDLSEFKFGDKIGEGGFGEVNYAIHIATKKKCAIKKLFLKELKGSDFDLFIREVENLAICDNMFCLAFLGCTFKYPFSIITQYIPNGSLFNALKHRDGSPDLDGTDKTLIAMGIAHGMTYLHKHGIIHRDLKSLNILLDEKKLPIICDFGLSRRQGESDIDSPENMMTKDVGTPHWMAPELFESNNYTNKVDVYAFGMIMWEMLTEMSPFKNMNGMQIAYAVCKKGERPQIPNITAEPMRAFINRCWNQDPNQRPTFEEIYKDFKTGKIAFSGTERTEVQKFIKYIKKDEANRAAVGEFKKPPLKTPNHPNRHRRSKESHPKQSPSTVPRHRNTYVDYNLLSQPENFDFMANFNLAIKNLKQSNADTFFEALKPVFQKKVDVNTMFEILSQIIKVIENDQDILQIMLENGIHTILPIGEFDLLSPILLIYLISAMHFPGIIDPKFLETISPFVSRCADKVLSIITYYFQPGDHQTNIWDVMDFIRLHSDTFLSQCGVSFVKLIHYIYTRNHSVKAVRFSDLVFILSKAVTSQDINIIHLSYNCIIDLFDPRIVVDQNTLINHLLNQQTISDVSNYLSRMPNVQITPQFIDALLIAAGKDKMALIALLGIAKKHSEAGKILISISDRWMITNRIKAVDVISLILILVSRKKLRNDLAHCELFAQWISSIPDTRDIELIDIAAKIVMKMIDEKQMLLNLTKNDFFKHYLTVVPTLDDIETTKTSIYIIDTIARSMLTTDFMIYIPIMFTMLKTNTELTFPALSAITVLSSHEKCAEVIRSLNYKSVMRSLKHNPSYKSYVDLLIQNITK
ncbi:TKL family protein kinase [Trichomonas vaginalis G3]|uniref:TKL family protein kinase n=1 Tax=Trichomonas vaginalis (strain ATCC PRA-98 / G3) TaxID=412133 RepID=A2EL45_TRIV3|nr:protein kinase protein [Trichomonas vaginalis G3]EAY06598.1 TKL family protein kinase [Trichomonas vaginalis G3]KAI5551640.1 protein kinase protein [Trichomonas vaginalis G3]|eukprot:XP_001318821.1 TKL family protein kinase [Trichomonas vaginalis G3]